VQIFFVRNWRQLPESEDRRCSFIKPLASSVSQLLWKSDTGLWCRLMRCNSATQQRKLGSSHLCEQPDMVQSVHVQATFCLRSSPTYSATSWASQTLGQSQGIHTGKVSAAVKKCVVIPRVKPATVELPRKRPEESHSGIWIVHVVLRMDVKVPNLCFNENCPGDRSEAWAIAWEMTRF
jgi:hypothetical protein